MGLGDLMYKLGIRYGSEEGQEFAAQVMEFVRFHCMQMSIDLAAERQPFLAYAGSIYDADQLGGMRWTPPRPLAPYRRNWGRPALNWEKVTEGIRPPWDPQCRADDRSAHRHHRHRQRL